MNAHGHPNVLITGAAHRIGRAIAFDLAAHGYGVAVHYLNSKDKADDLVGEIREAGGRAAAISADLADEAQVRALVPAATAALGPLTVLVNNASLFENDTIHDAAREGWDRHMEVNLRAPFVLSQTFADQLPDGLEGNIINILDQRVWNLTPFFMSYTVSKAGLWTLTQTMALALAPRIRVNGVGPGPTIRNVRQSEDDFARQWSETPMQRRVMPDEIADAVRFIIHAPSMTGQMIAIDGGQHMGWAQASNKTAPQE
ncbi:MAG: SDR family oxidoreductase [Alphaproteobacteria bacterium]|nr:SDR family oxidoreductase [Alphaproteobacteria bacterium]MBF0251164.1 SDR family oxidoreductase [Alphaproteobacteria bacterium]